MPKRQRPLDLYAQFIRLHVLHHASREAVFGQGMIDELRRHGYRMSPGTIYPLLHALENEGLLRSKEERGERRPRRVYAATAKGRRLLQQSKRKLAELFRELLENDEEIIGSR